MLRSLYSAVSGLHVNQQAMDVIGNNIANVNTIGFKESRAVFQDLLSQTLTGGKSPTDSRGGINPRQVGSGAYLVAVDNIIEQGVIKSTSASSDLAIEGNGFFILRGESTSKYYSRAGDFNFDQTGVLTSPSGYRVQGWMADPRTGKVQFNASASDIAITDAHRIMQAHATENIDYAGILDSGSIGSIHTFNPMLTQADANMNLQDVYSYAGSESSLGLSNNEVVTVKAHATDLTSMNQVYNVGGQSLNLRPGLSTVVFDVGGNRYTLSYGVSDSPAQGQFATLGGFVDALNYVFASNPGEFGSAAARLEEGQLYIDGGGAPGTSFTINSISCGDSTYLTTIMSALQGAYSDSTSNKHSSAIYYQRELRVNEDFRTLGELSTVIEGSILGNVLNNFTTQFLENNFGLRDGEILELAFNVETTSGSPSTTLVTYQFVYKDGTPLPSPSPANGTGQFHTLNDLANLIDRNLRADVTNFGGGSANGISVVVNGEGLDFRFNNTANGAVSLAAVSTWDPTHTNANRSPYLQGCFGDLFDENGNPIRIDQNYRNMSVHEISGKGRITYNNTASGFQIISGPTNIITAAKGFGVYGGLPWTATTSISGVPATGSLSNATASTANVAATMGSNFNPTTVMNVESARTGYLNFTLTGGSAVPSGVPGEVYLSAGYTMRVSFSDAITGITYSESVQVDGGTGAVTWPSGSAAGIYLQNLFSSNPLTFANMVGNHSVTGNSWYIDTTAAVAAPNLSVLYVDSGVNNFLEVDGTAGSAYFYRYNDARHVYEKISGVTNVALTGTVGSVTFNPDFSRTLSGFSIEKASSGGIFNANILEHQNGVLTSGMSDASLKFLTVATENTLLLDLFTYTGQPCAFVEDNTQINFNAVIDGSALTNANIFSVTVGSTVQNMMDALEQYLGLGPSFNTKKNVVLQNGAMTVYGENGEANNIDSLKLNATPNSRMFAFNDNIGMPKENPQKASGGRFVSDQTIYDQQGNEHVVKFDFAAYNSEKNEWTLTLTTSDIHARVSIDGATSNTIVLRFNPDGTPAYNYDPNANPPTMLPNPTITFDPGNGTNRLSGIHLFLGSSGKNDGLTLSRANTSINTAENDGYPLGVLQQTFFNEAGEAIGYYTNGQVRVIAQLALATFQNNRGLKKVGDTMFAETPNSGHAAIGTPQSGFRGQIASNSLEQSNVDLATEFVSMITTQRGFQANSRVVTTSDEMIQELLNLKR